MGNGNSPPIAQWDILYRTLLADMSCLFPYRYLPLTTLVVRKYVAGTDNEPLANVEFKVTDGSGAAVGPDNGIYWTDAQFNAIDIEYIGPHYGWSYIIKGFLY